MIFYGLLGLMLILGAILAEHSLQDMFLLNFISEGFYIGGWVLFWEFSAHCFSNHGNMLSRLLY